MANRRIWGLLLIGLMLLAWLAACNATATNPPANTPLPTWGPMPTRHPTPTPDGPPVMASITAIQLHNLRVALLAGNMDDAQQAWEQAAAAEPENGEVQREGARLALIAGELSEAAERIWDALSARPYDAQAWILLGLILQRQGQPDAAHQALEVAQTLAPNLTPEMFPLRWQTARQAQDSVALQSLAQQYFIENPNAPLALYYRAEALLASNAALAARDFLLLSMKGDEPAVMWYTLGRAYLATGASQEAAQCFETAHARRTDGTLAWAAENPDDALEIALAHAYLRGQNCQQAELLFARLSTPYPELAALREAAIVCQTPTPTMTPWIVPQTPIPGSQDN